MIEANMEEKMVSDSLLFIPYQDTDNFYKEGIMTREFAILSLLYDSSFKRVINIKKPRTILDKRRYKVNVDNFPVGSIEYDVKDICDNALTIQYLTFFATSQITKRRNWWIGGYERTINLIPWEKLGSGLVYSDNPFAVKLLKESKKKGMKIYFDVMDNFAIHPSLSMDEKKGAMDAYKEIMTFADVVSANSIQTCEFMKQKTKREPFLVKNGVFLPRNKIKYSLIDELQIIKKEYKNCVGYIGKLGLRIDADLIETIAQKCEDTLFVIIGPFLKGQTSEKLQKVIKHKKNVIHFDSIPSAYVYPTIEEFDICMLPHSVGEAENGGDPLKLYQYMTTDKPIISTKILGVDEFSGVVKISNNIEDWVEFIKTDHQPINRNTDLFTWKTRFKPIADEISKLI